MTKRTALPTVVKQYELVAPNGQVIVGLLEQVSTTAYFSLESPERDKEGQFNTEYTGQSEVHWDGQHAQTSKGERLFLDDLGNEWRESQLTPREIAQ